MNENPSQDNLLNSILDALDAVLPAKHHVDVAIRARDLMSRHSVTPETALNQLLTILTDAGLECEIIHVGSADAPPLSYVVASSMLVEQSTTSRPVQSVDGKALVVRGSVASFLSQGAEKSTMRTSTPRRETEYHHAQSFSDLWPYLRSILREEKTDIWVVIGYSVLSSLLALVVPITAQAIVNSVALGVFNKQLIVLCSLVFLGLLASGVLAVLERWVIELIQRRIFVHASFDIMQRLPSIRLSALREQYAPELVNRFFDVITIQKSLGKFLLEGINAALVLLVGLIVLAIYHPFFLLYDVVLIAFLPVLVFGLGRGGITTAIEASKRKYETASWLEEIARAQLAVKLTGARSFAFDRLDTIAAAYVQDRRRHFVILSRQIFGSMFFKSVATVGVLGLGGMLVIDQQMSLGQLVAAQIVIIMILNAVEKLIGQLDLYYDLMAAIGKVASISDKPLEDVGGIPVPASANGGSIRVRDVWFTYEHAHQPALRGASLDVPPGGRISLIGASGSGKTTLLHSILGLELMQRGVITVNDVDVRSADLTSLRSRVALVSPLDQLVDGTIEENIMLGRSASHEDLQWAMRMVCLLPDVDALPDGLRTALRADGLTISFGMQRRILFARMILHRPEILLLDEAFDGIEESTKQRMLSEIFAHREWTIVNVSHDEDVVRRTQAVYALKDGCIHRVDGGLYG